VVLAVTHGFSSGWTTFAIVMTVLPLARYIGV
jgi:hypothetical protein